MVAAPWTEKRLFLLLNMLLLRVVLLVTVDDEEAPVDDGLTVDDTVVESGLAVPLLSCFLLPLFMILDGSLFTSRDNIWAGKICSIANTAAVAA